MAHRKSPKFEGKSVKCDKCGMEENGVPATRHRRCPGEGGKIPRNKHEKLPYAQRGTWS